MIDLPVPSQELAALEATNMALQKKVNKLQVEHVSEEEVDQVRHTPPRQSGSAPISCRDCLASAGKPERARALSLVLAVQPSRDCSSLFVWLFREVGPACGSVCLRVGLADRACLASRSPPSQLFYALEVKEEQLEQANKEKADLEQEVLTARQLSARGGAMGVRTSAATATGCLPLLSLPLSHARVAPARSASARAIRVPSVAAAARRMPTCYRAPIICAFG